MKNKLALILAAAMTVSAVGVNVTAAEEYPQVTVVINGQELSSDQPAVIIDGRTMVPMRAIGEALNVVVNWESDTKTVVFSKDGTTASMIVGSKALIVTDGSSTHTVSIDSPAVIINSRTLVPVRFISENFGATVDWNNSSRTVTITGAVEEEKPETIDPSAVEITKTLASSGEACADYLKDYTGEMTQNQKDRYAEYCNSVAQCHVVLDSASQAYTGDDLYNMNEALYDAIDGFDELAEELGIEDELGDYISDLTNGKFTSRHINHTHHHISSSTSDFKNELSSVKSELATCKSKNRTLQSMEMSYDQAKYYEELVDKLSSVSENIDRYDTVSDCENAIQTLTTVEQGFDELINDINSSNDDDDDSSYNNNNNNNNSDFNTTLAALQDLLDECATKTNHVSNYSLTDEQSKYLEDIQNQIDSVLSDVNDYTTVKECNDAIETLTAVEQGLDNLLDELRED